MSNVFNIKEERKNLKKYKKIFKIGTRVVFHNNMPGIWYDLGMMTGVITKQTNDCAWSFVVEIDRPDLLNDCICWGSTKTGGLEATVHGSALTLLEHVKINQPKIVSKLNKGTGININRLECTYGFTKNVSKELGKLYSFRDKKPTLKSWKKSDENVAKLMKECLSYKHSGMVKTNTIEDYYGKKDVFECPHCKYVVHVYKHKKPL